MAMERPIVAFDLVETRRTAGDAALYASPDDSDAFAACIDELLDDPEGRARLGKLGRSRVLDSLSWEHSSLQLIAAYTHALAPTHE